MSERQGIEIDYCPQCRGVWLDRGELDKIIARAEGVGAREPPPPSQPETSWGDQLAAAEWTHQPAAGWDQPTAPPPQQQQPWSGGQHGHGHEHGGKRRKSWLEEMFD
jgi:Zn-finger nucleic acid-binding protein